MTNHIKELMKSAGVSKYRHFRQYNYAQVPHGEKELQKSIDAGIECVDVRNCKDNDCIYWNELHYPKFTPAKQLELIKLIVEKCQEIKIYKNKYIDSFLFQAQESWGEYEYKADVENFDSCLAALILELLKNNELNKSEVKRILEDF